MVDDQRLTAQPSTLSTEHTSAQMTRLRVAVHPVGDDGSTRPAAVRLRAAATHSRCCELVDDAIAADLVLVIALPDRDYNQRATRRDAVFRRWYVKCVVFSEQDAAAALCPGIYVGQPTGRWLAPGWAAPGPYVGKIRPSELPGDGVHEPIEHLYSFAGDVNTHPIRERLVALRDERAVLLDTSATGCGADAERRLTFDRTLARSAYVLCPRGRVPASIRFFETLRAGRAPVILADDWVLPHGPDWEAFVLRVRETEIERLPALLREVEADAPRRGRLARQAWESWFSDEVLFDRLIDVAIQIQRERQDTMAGRVWRSRLLLSREHRRNTLRLWRHALLRLRRGFR